MGGPAHILLHDAHTVAGLDVEAAGIEGDALAADRDFGRAGRAPFQHQEARGFDGGAADGMDHRVVFLDQGVPHHGGDAGAVALAQGGHAGVDLFGAHIGGGRVHKVSQGGDGVCLLRQAGGVFAGRDQEARRGGLLGLVAIETVRPVCPARSDGREGIPPRRGDFIVACRQLCRERGGGELVPASAEAVEDMRRAPLRPGHQHGLPCPAGKALCPGNRPRIRERIVLQRAELAGRIKPYLDGSGCFEGEGFMHFGAFPGFSVVNDRACGVNRTLTPPGQYKPDLQGYIHGAC